MRNVFSAITLPPSLNHLPVISHHLRSPLAELCLRPSWGSSTEGGLHTQRGALFLRSCHTPVFTWGLITERLLVLQRGASSDVFYTTSHLTWGCRNAATSHYCTEPLPSFNVEHLTHTEVCHSLRLPQNSSLLEFLFTHTTWGSEVSYGLSRRVFRASGLL